MMSLRKLIKVKMYRMLYTETLRSILHSRLNIAPTHTEITYIQSSGAQYIDTSIKGQNVLKIEIKISKQTTTGDSFFFGSRVDGSSQSVTLGITSSGDMYCGWGQGTTYVIGGIQLNTIYTFTKTDRLMYINGTYTTPQTAVTPYISAYNIYLFALNDHGVLTSPTKTKLYYCKIWDNSNNLIRDFIPVLKAGEYCLFDKVSQTYFSNKGTGAFTGA